VIPGTTGLQGVVGNDAAIGAKGKQEFRESEAILLVRNLQDLMALEPKVIL
jgi:hypothetical protein